MKAPVRVAVTGAAGQIGYSLLFRIASGQMLGPRPAGDPAAPRAADGQGAGGPEGRDDGARGLRVPAARRDDRHRRPEGRLQGRRTCALLVGAKPRGPGHGAQGPAARERQDLHRAGQGARRGRGARHPRARRRQPGQHQRLHRDEVGAVAAAGQLHRDDAPRPQPRAVAARGEGERARRLDRQGRRCGATTRRRCTPTTASRPSGGRLVKELIDDENWNRNEFLPKVGKRGAAIIEARGLSSAASAANAAIDHVRDWVLGSGGKWVTMGIASDGSYGIPKDVMYGIPGDHRRRRVHDRPATCRSTTSRASG